PDRMGSGQGPLLRRPRSGQPRPVPVIPEIGPEHAVDQPGDPLVPPSFGEVDRLMDRRPGWNPVQIMQLVYAQPEQLPDPGLEGAHAPFDKPVEYPVQGVEPLDRAVNQLGGQAAVPGRQGNPVQGAAQQQIAVGSPLFDGDQDIEGNLPGP